MLTKFTVEVGQAITVDLIAKVQATHEVIEVTAGASIVQTENANLSTTFTTKQMEELPLPGGDMTSIAFTAPGISMSTGGGYGNFSAHGMPGVSNLFTINGNDYNDPYLNLNSPGASNLLLGINEVQEAAVVTNAYSVQYPRRSWIFPRPDYFASGWSIGRPAVVKASGLCLALIHWVLENTL